MCVDLLQVAGGMKVVGDGVKILIDRGEGGMAMRALERARLIK